jgi:CheY-like chemotaxis protein
MPMALILVAEDERDIRELIELTLNFAGLDVVTAKDGVEAVAKAQTEPIDLILMDVRMPRMTGYEACRRLQEIDATREIPVVFLSAKGQEAEVEEGLAAGAQYYILKPFAPDALSNRVYEILAETGRV